MMKRREANFTDTIFSYTPFKSSNSNVKAMYEFDGKKAIHNRCNRVSTFIYYHYDIMYVLEFIFTLLSRFSNVLRWFIHMVFPNLSCLFGINIEVIPKLMIFFRNYVIKLSSDDTLHCCADDNTSLVCLEMNWMHWRHQNECRRMKGYVIYIFIGFGSSRHFHKENTMN